MSRPMCTVPECSLRGIHDHHAIRAQTIRREGGSPRDARWLVPLCLEHHFNHEHGGAQHKLPLTVLPDQVFTVARLTFGAGRAFNELRRAYTGDDPRLDALLSEWEGERDAA